MLCEATENAHAKHEARGNKATENLSVKCKARGKRHKVFHKASVMIKTNISAKLDISLCVEF